MKLEAIREAARATPFEPFWLCLTNGRTVEVRHQDLIGFAPWGTITVNNDSDDSPHFIKPVEVGRIEKAPGYECDRNVIAIRNALAAATFTPFVIRLGDGRTYSVPAPQHVAVSPWGRKVIHFRPGDDLLTVLDPPFIRDLELLPVSIEAGTGV